MMPFLDGEDCKVIALCMDDAGMLLGHDDYCINFLKGVRAGTIVKTDKLNSYILLLFFRSSFSLFWDKTWHYI